MKVIIRVETITDWGECNAQERKCPLMWSVLDRLGRMAEDEPQGF